MNHYNKIKLEDIKIFFEAYSIKISTKFDDKEIFYGLNSLLKASDKDITFFNDFKLLSDLKKSKAKATMCRSGIFKYSICTLQLL